MTRNPGKPRGLNGCQTPVQGDGDAVLGVVSVWSGSWEVASSPCSCLHVGNQPDQRMAYSSAAFRTRAPLPWAQRLGLVPASTIVQSSCVPTWPSSPKLSVEWLGLLRSDVTGPRAAWKVGTVAVGQAVALAVWLAVLCKVGHAVPMIPDQ